MLHANEAERATVQLPGVPGVLIKAQNLLAAHPTGPRPSLLLSVLWALFNPLNLPDFVDLGATWRFNLYRGPLRLAD